jgi:hypothetical protein
MVNAFKPEILIISLALLLLGCNEEKKLKDILVDYNTEMTDKFPEGDHPNPLTIGQGAFISRRIALLEQFEQKLMAIDSSKLEESGNQILKGELTALSTQKYFWQNYYKDPSAFDVTGYFQNQLSNTTDTILFLQQMSAELEKVPEHFENAKKIITSPDPDKSALSVQQQILFLRFLQIDLPDIIKSSDLPDKDKSTLLSRIKASKIASKDFIGFCESLIFEHFDSTFVRPQNQ